MQKTKEKRKDIHLNEEFQRIARRDKKVFLSGQCREIEENNRKTRYLLLREAEDIKKRWQEYTEELYTKKIFMTQITTMV